MEARTMAPEEMPDSELFLHDTEAWYRRRHPDWNEDQIENALKDVRLSSLLQFYEEVIKLYPDLASEFPLLPARPYSGYLTSGAGRKLSGPCRNL